MFFGVGFIIIVFTKNKQALHDILSSSLIVRKDFQNLGVVYKNETNAWIKALIFFSIIIPLIGIIAAIAIPFYENKRIREQVVSELGQVRLGMRPVDVSLSLGKADNYYDTADIYESSASLMWKYGTLDTGEISKYYLIVFKGKDVDSLRVSQVCTKYPHYLNLSGIPYISEYILVKKLGTPTTESIDSTGTSKLISFKANNLAFLLTEGSVKLVCVTDHPLSFPEEYKDSSY